MKFVIMALLGLTAVSSIQLRKKGGDGGKKGGKGGDQSEEEYEITPQDIIDELDENVDGVVTLDEVTDYMQA
jgi:hypothetical protein